MSSNDQGQHDGNSSLKTSELLSMLSRGSGALARWASDTEDKGLTEFLNSSIESILQRSKQQEDKREYKLKHSRNQNEPDDQKISLELVKEEEMILQGITQVQSRVFEGKHHGPKYTLTKDISNEWAEKQKRKRETRLIMYNGMECLPDRTFELVSMNNITFLSPLKSFAASRIFYIIFYKRKKT
jgi:hypothetical protein